MHAAKLVHALAEKKQQEVALFGSEVQTSGVPNCVERPICVPGKAEEWKRCIPAPIRPRIGAITGSKAMLSGKNTSRFIKELGVDSEKMSRKAHGNADSRTNLPYDETREGGLSSTMGRSASPFA